MLSETGNMAWSSWFLRNKSSKNPHQQSNQQPQKSDLEEEELLGVTSQLIEHIKSFTLDTFKNFPLQEEENISFGDQTSTEASANVRKDLSEWQERHATLVLSRVKELSQLRFVLCPRHLKERQFWRIYFTLVRIHVTEYELQAIRVAKLKRMAIQNEKSSDTTAVEVEMAETKATAGLQHQSP